MLFRKKDNAEKLITLQKSDQKKLNALQKKLESLRPKWLELQAECERLEALSDASFGTYRGPRGDENQFGRRARTHEPFFNQRQEDLSKLVEEACEKRDNLTFGVAKEIDELTATAFQRLAHVYGDFGSFCNVVADSKKSGGSFFQCDEALRQELLTARGKAEAMTDGREMLDFIIGWVNRVEEMDLQSIPLFRLDQSIEKALDVSVKLEPEYPQTAKSVTGDDVKFDTTGPGISY